MGQFDQRNDSLVQGANTGVQAFMSQVYGWMTVGLLLTAFVAWYSVSSGLYYTIATNKILFFGMIIAELGLAVEARMNIEDLSLTIHAHPTLGEIIMEAAEVALGTPIHMVAKK